MKNKGCSIKSLQISLVKIISSGFFLGYIPFMPGTFGTMLGVIFFLFLSNFLGNFLILGIFLFVLFSIFIADFSEKNIFKIKDAKEIVIDEICGIMVAMYGLRNNLTLIYVLIAFLLFRFFDIIKPFPIKKLQKLNGGVGIVIDDFIAGIYTYLLIYFFSSLFRLSNATV